MIEFFSQRNLRSQFYSQESVTGVSRSSKDVSSIDETNQLKPYILETLNEKENGTSAKLIKVPGNVND